MTTPAHAIHAPSSAHRWIVCSASATGLAHIPETDEGEEAAEGTAAHDEIERIFGSLDGEMVTPATMPILPVAPDHPAAYGIALLVNYVRQLPPGRMWIEKRVTLTKDIWGRSDVQHWHEESATLTIPDYKNGFVDVDVVENEQLRIYGAGSIFTNNLPAKWIRYVVVQPNSFMPVPRVKQWIESAADLMAFATKAAAIPAQPPTFAASVGEHCRDCRLFGLCPTSKDVLLQLQVMLGRPATDVTPAQVAQFMACDKPIEHWFKALWKHGTKLALDGKVPPGMKVVTSTTRRDWKNADAARDAVMAKLGVKALDPPTPAQAENLGMSADEIAVMVVKPPGGPALAFESDKRPPFVRKSAAEMFAGAVPPK